MITTHGAGKRCFMCFEVQVLCTRGACRPRGHDTSINEATREPATTGSPSACNKSPHRSTGLSSDYPGSAAQTGG